MMNYVTRRNDDLDVLGDLFLGNFFNEASSNNGSLLKSDIKETNENYFILIDVPGFSKDNIKLSYENKCLTVSATSAKVEEDKNVKYLRQERFIGTCTRTFYVGEIDQASILASFENGVLTITIPKQEYKKVEEKKYIAIN